MAASDSFGMMVRAGDYRHAVAFDEPVASQGASGEELITWTQAFVARAALEPMSGRELQIASGIVAPGDTMIRVRWNRGTTARITAKWRARFRDTVYNIAAPPVNVKMRDRELQIAVSTGVNNG